MYISNKYNTREVLVEVNLKKFNEVAERGSRV